MAKVTISYEDPRGCGFRKPGKEGYGIYLMGDGPSAPCGRLPFPLTICPCCGGGVKFSRGFTWITPAKLFKDTQDIECKSPICWSCPMNFLETMGKAGLVWIGEKFYKTPGAFRHESQHMGISRKLPSIPKGFDIGNDWIFLAHNKAITYANEDGDPVGMPGVFMAFKPRRIDLVIDDENDIPPYCEKLQEEWGEDKIHIVKVIKNQETEAS